MVSEAAATIFATIATWQKDSSMGGGREQLLQINNWRDGRLLAGIDTQSK